MQHTQSEKLFAQAETMIPGGVNSPVRAFKSVGINPVYIERGEQAHVFDVDGNEYIDFISSWGPLVLGHAHPAIVGAITREVSKGTSFGACTSKEVDMARVITSLYPTIEKVRMVNSGTEATMSAIRLARGYTAKDKIIKFEGCYHGHADSFLIQAGSGLATFSAPGCSGITKQTADNTLVASYNDIASVERLLQAYPNQIAAVIVEPVMGNMGIILPEDDFLCRLRALTEQQNIVLIFDEVITGFRVSAGGAQSYYGITPDLTCLGKIIGGGLPVGAFGGKREIMDMLSPVGPVYQAGTLSGNPLALAAGLAMLHELARPNFYLELEDKAVAFEGMVRDTIAPYADRLSYNRAGSLSTLFFKGGGVRSYRDAMQADTNQYAMYFNAMLGEGIYLAPSQFEAIFLSAAHTATDLEQTARALHQALKQTMK